MEENANVLNSEILSDNSDSSGLVSLPDEIMEALAGGQLTQEEMMFLDYIIGMYRNAGKSLDDLLEYAESLGDGVPDPIPGHPDRRTSGVPADKIAEIQDYFTSRW